MQETYGSMSPTTAKIVWSIVIVYLILAHISVQQGNMLVSALGFIIIFAVSIILSIFGK